MFTLHSDETAGNAISVISDTTCNEMVHLNGSIKSCLIKSKHDPIQAK